MTLSSMTGYGRGESSSGGMSVEVELCSVNRKQFDIRIHLPRTLMALEANIRELVKKSISRGMITGAIRITVTGKARLGGVAVDRELARAYVKALGKTAADLNLKNDLTIRSVANLPNVLQYSSVADDSGKVWTVLKQALRLAVDQLIKMRKAEGVALKKDISSRMRILKQQVGMVQKRAPVVVREYRNLIAGRLKKTRAEFDSRDPALLREIALFADKSDISEEIVRLQSHISQSTKLLASGAPSGRALDFLCQEMFREINTIGSKANDVKISSYVVKLKTELECVREQVQNVE